MFFFCFLKRENIANTFLVQALTFPGFEIKNHKLLFAIHFENFTENFFLIFVTLTNQVITAHPSITLHNKLQSKRTFFTTMPFYLAFNSKVILSRHGQIFLSGPSKKTSPQKCQIPPPLPPYVIVSHHYTPPIHVTRHIVTNFFLVLHILYNWHVSGRN